MEVLDCFDMASARACEVLNSIVLSKIGSQVLVDGTRLCKAVESSNFFNIGKVVMNLRGLSRYKA